MKTHILGFVILLPSLCLAQPDSAVYALFLKGGVSKYANIIPGGLGGSRSSTRWKTGPTMGVGFQLPATRTVSLMVVLDYSTNPYQTPSGSQLLGDAEARTVDLSVSARTLALPFYIAAGFGFFHTSRGDVTISSRIDSSRVVVDRFSGDSETSFFLNLALGFPYALTSRWSVFIQVNARLRRYSSFAVETGIAYAL
jgi:hypothetical protein